MQSEEKIMFDRIRCVHRERIYSLILLLSYLDATWGALLSVHKKMGGERGERGPSNDLLQSPRSIFSLGLARLIVSCNGTARTAQYIQWEMNSPY